MNSMCYRPRKIAVLFAMLPMRSSLEQSSSSLFLLLNSDVARAVPGVRLGDPVNGTESYRNPGTILRGFHHNDFRRMKRFRLLILVPSQEGVFV